MASVAMVTIGSTSAIARNFILAIIIIIIIIIPHLF
jgi:hypothetical protein